MSGNRGSATSLRRVLGLTEVTAGGVGIIIGAGIYVLLGAATAHAGPLVWLAFLVAAVLSALTGSAMPNSARCFQAPRANTSTRGKRMPEWVAFVVGWTMIIGLVVAAATVSIGFARYVGYFVDVDARVAALGLLTAVSGVATVGIKHSARLTVALSAVQVGGLLLVVAIGLPHVGDVDLFTGHGAGGVLGAAALMFFAFIGFDEVITLVEETRDPTRTVPRALLLALGLSTALYIAVAVAAVSVLGADALAASPRPLADVMAHVLGDRGATVVAAIAIMTTTNTTLLAVTAASRVMYGMAKAGAMPRAFAFVHSRRGTPVRAILAVALVAASVRRARRLCRDRRRDGFCRLCCVPRGQRHGHHSPAHAPGAATPVRRRGNRRRHSRVAGARARIGGPHDDAAGAARDRSWGGALHGRAGGRLAAPAKPIVAWHQQWPRQCSRPFERRRADLRMSTRSAAWPSTAPTCSPRARGVGRSVMLGQQFTDFMILVLLVAAVISGLIGEATDTIAIVAIVVLNAVIGFIQEYRAERAMEALKAMAAPTATVAPRRRPSASCPASELVPGDVVLLEAGGIVPADLRLLESAQLRVDEAALTGESVPVEKSIAPSPTTTLPLGDRRNMAYKGTMVTYGHGRGVVVATGMATEFGKIAALLQEAGETRHPPAAAPGALRPAAGGRGPGICGVVFGVGLLRGEAPLLMFLTAVSLAVAAIPEALPAVVTIALALGAQQDGRKRTP